MNPNWLRWLLWLAAAGCVAGGLLAVELSQNGKEKNIMKLTSTTFAAGKPIPARFTCDNADVSPPLHWTGAPAGTKCFALICDDPDAPVGDWVHWVIYGIPPTATGLPEKVVAAAILPDGTRQGVNDFGRIGYGGPCPPPGKPHRYFFRLYALDAPLDLMPRANKLKLEEAMAGHMIAEAELMGTYQRVR